MVPPVTEQTVSWREPNQGSSEALALRVGPMRLRLVENRDLRHVVKPQEREPASPPHVQRDSHGDASQPSAERFGRVQIVEAAKGPEIHLLHGVLCRDRVAEHAQRRPVDHRLGRLDELATRVDVAAPGAIHQFWQ